jgi:BirA family biotin operon repressor/biotin-[acetyl-CoA-carboxylase] ligase
MAGDALTALRLALGPGVDLQAVAECPSTNSALLEAARQGLTAPRLLVADRQTAGRGRLGRAWHSWAGASLTFSLAWPWQGAPLTGLSLAVGAALAEALEPQGRRVRLKWPNDLRLDEAKLGGILIETVLQGDRVQAVVVGVGLNVAEPEADPGQPAAGLQRLDPRWTASTALSCVGPALVALLNGWPREGWAGWRTAFEARDALRGLRVQAGALQGTVLGVDGEGALTLRDDAGGLHAVAAGEVSVRSMEG